MLIPIRVGAGLRLGVNAGYMKFLEEAALAAFLRRHKSSAHKRPQLALEVARVPRKAAPPCSTNSNNNRPTRSSR